MQCKNCSNSLVMRHTREYMLDDNGVYNTEGEHTETFQVHCYECGAEHEYEELHQSGDKYTIAPAINSDPIPVTIVALNFNGGELTNLQSTALVGLIIIDEDKQEVGTFLTQCDLAWLDRADTLARKIPSDKWKASYDND